MFKVGQKVWCNLRGWGTIGLIELNRMYVDFAKAHGRCAAYTDGRYAHHQEQSILPGKPIISGYESPPFEGKLKKGETVVVYEGSKLHAVVVIDTEFEDRIVTSPHGWAFYKNNFTIHRIEKEPVY